MQPLYIALIVAAACFVLYALDRRIREEPVDWLTALKFVGIGGILSGGVAYTTSTQEVAAVVEAVKNVPEVAQEMFVGVPTF